MYLHISVVHCGLNEPELERIVMYGLSGWKVPQACNDEQTHIFTYSLSKALIQMLSSPFGSLVTSAKTTTSIYLY